MQTPEQVRALTVAAFCQMYGVGRTYFYNEVNAGRLLVRKAGKRTLVLKEDAEAWLARLPKSSLGPRHDD